MPLSWCPALHMSPEAKASKAIEHQLKQQACLARAQINALWIGERVGDEVESPVWDNLQDQIQQQGYAKRARKLMKRHPASMSKANLITGQEPPLPPVVATGVPNILTWHRASGGVQESQVNLRHSLTLKLVNVETELNTSSRKWLWLFDHVSVAILVIPVRKTYLTQAIARANEMTQMPALRHASFIAVFAFHCESDAESGETRELVQAEVPGYTEEIARDQTPVEYLTWVLAVQLMDGRPSKQQTLQHHVTFPGDTELLRFISDGVYSEQIRRQVLTASSELDIEVG